MEIKPDPADYIGWPSLYDEALKKWEQRAFCVTCNGTGFIEYESIPGHACSVCNGSGKVNE